MIDTNKSRIRQLEEAIGNAIYIMDEKGRQDPKGKSYYLWESYWNDLRYTLVKAKDPTVEEGVMRV